MFLWPAPDDARRVLGWISVAIVFEAVAATSARGPRSLISDALVGIASLCAIGAFVGAFNSARRLMR